MTTRVTDLNVHDEEHPMHGELEPTNEVKTKNLRPTLNGNFGALHLDGNPLRTVQVGSNLSVIVIEGFVNCLKANNDLFAISPHEMLG